MRRLYFLALAATLTLAGAAPAHAQFGLPKIPKIPGVKTEIPGLADLRKKLLGDDEPLTTSLADVYQSMPYLDDYKPLQIMPMTELPMNRDYEPLRIPGLFEIPSQSFCLRAGTFPPSKNPDLYKGDGYQYAPLKGPKSAIISKLLRAGAAHPEVPQHDVQILLWAIIARTKPSDFPKSTLNTAKALLTPNEMKQLDGGVLSFIPPEYQGKAMENLPPDVQNVLQAENNMRQALANHVNDAVAPVENTTNRIDSAANLPGQRINAQSDALYSEMESIAMRVGVAPDEGPNRIPAGRWNYEPSGYFIRLLPNGYSFTLRQVYHPEPLTVKRGADNKIESITMKTGDVATFTYAGANLQSATITSRLTKGKPVPVAAAGGNNTSKAWDGIKNDFRSLPAFGKVADATGLESDLKDIVALRAQTKPDDAANDFLARAFMSRFAEYATGSGAVAYGGNTSASVQIAGRVNMAMRVVGGRGSGGFGSGGGGGAGMGSPGKQRLGQGSGKSPDATDRAKKGVDAISKLGKFGRVQNIPLSLGTRLANWICDTGGQAARGLMGDPPRPDFTTFATFTAKPLPPINWTTGQVSAKRKAAIESFLAEFLNLNERMRTAQTDLDRMGGAGDAGNSSLQYDQGCAFVAEKRRIGQQMVVVAQKARALKAVLESENAGNEAATAEQLQALQSRIATTGFSADDLQAAHQVGTTDAEIAESKRALSQGEGFDDLKGKTFNSLLGETADAMDDLGSYWATLPDPTPFMNTVSVNGG